MMQYLNFHTDQFGWRLIIVVFLMVYCMQIIGLEHFTFLVDVDHIEASMDLESDGEEKKSGEDIDDHLSQGDFFGQRIARNLYSSSFFLSKRIQKTHLGPVYPPPELV